MAPYITVRGDGDIIQLDPTLSPYDIFCVEEPFFSPQLTEEKCGMLMLVGVDGLGDASSEVPDSVPSCPKFELMGESPLIMALSLSSISLLPDECRLSS